MEPLQICIHPWSHEELPNNSEHHIPNGIIQPKCLLLYFEPKRGSSTDTLKVGNKVVIAFHKLTNPYSIQASNLRLYSVKVRVKLRQWSTRHTFADAKGNVMLIYCTFDIVDCEGGTICNHGAKSHQPKLFTIGLCAAAPSYQQCIT